MKAVQLTENLANGRDLRISDVPQPLISAPQDLLVRNTVIGVNYIDTYHRTGLYKLPFPFILGREAVGEVVEVHEQATHGFKLGDRVAYIGPNTYAEYTIANAQTTVLVPSTLSDEIAAAVLIQGCTALALTTRAVQVLPEDWVLVLAAAGGTGSWLVQICKAFGARVIGTASTQEKCEIAKAAGCDEVILTPRNGQVDLAARVMSLTGGQGVRIAYDGVGKDTFESTLNSLQRLGWFISFGNASGKVPPFDAVSLAKKNIRFMRPALFSFWEDREEFQRIADEAFQLLLTGKIKVSIHGRWKLEEAGLAHEAIESRLTSGKLLLIPS